MEQLSRAVMQRRALPSKGLDFFPTPPWATRAFVREVLQARWNTGLSTCWEPAAGAGHMAGVLSEFFFDVRCSDVEDYGAGFEVGSFVGQGPDVAPTKPCDWVITNPPFNLAIDFAERALSVATVGVGLLLRSSWMEGAERYERLFAKRPPYLIVPYCERVPMVAGKWDPAASSATSYAWFVWSQRGVQDCTQLEWIKPGAKARNWRDDDLKRWAT